MKLPNKVKSLITHSGVVEVTALIGAAWYLIQSIRFTHIQPALLDEGTYLVKGYLFATGQYAPFQEYGIWTNHMPFSFLIPGYFEKLLDPVYAPAGIYQLLSVY